MLQRLVVHFDRTSQKRMAMPAGSTHAVKQEINLGNQRLQERTRVRFNQGEHRAERGSGRAPILAGKEGDRLFPTVPALPDDSSLRFDSSGEPQHALRVPPAVATLLFLEQIQQSAVVRKLGPETLGDNFPF